MIQMTPYLAKRFFHWRSFFLFPWKSCSCGLGPGPWWSRAPASGQGLGGSLQSPSMQLVGAPGRIGEEGQGGGLPQGDARAAPVRLQQRIAADPATTQPTMCWMSPSSFEALKTTPTGPPSRRCTSTASSWGALTLSCRCTRSGTRWKN